jgi:hypothetical protein
VHFGVRVGERYVDPMLLFGPPDLTKLVRLIPSEFGPGSPLPEREGLLDGFEVGDGCGSGSSLVGDAISAACDVAVAGARAVKGAWDKAGEYLDEALRALKAAGRAGREMARRLGHSLRALLDRLQDVSAEVADRLRATRLGRILDAAVTAGRYLVESFAQECSEHAPPADGSGGSDNVMLAVGGIDSHRDQGDARSFGLPAGRLGYAPDERYWFSYRGSSDVYSARDTYQDLRESARLLARQLRQAQREHPGRAFDLVGHSQGGVVIDVFLVEFYEGHEDEYPPIENVVTFASPHEGTPLATTAQDLRASAFGSVFLGVLGALDESPGLPGPRANAASIQQLGERSDVIREIQQAGVPKGIHYTSIAGADDPVVPADHTDLPGAQTVRLYVGSALESHSGILGDPRALMAARAALEHRPLPCTGYREKLESAIGPALVTTIETIAGPGP